MSEYEIDFPEEIGPAESLSSTERIRRHRSAERAWVGDRMARVGAAYLGSPLDSRLDEEINLLLEAILEADEASELGSHASVGRKAEGRAFGLVGPSGTGKSRAMKRVFTRRPELAGFGTPDCLLVSITTPSPCTPRLLGQRMLDASGYVSQRTLAENEAWELAGHHLRLADIRIVHVDEAQHITEMADKGMVQKVRNSLKTLMAPGCARHFILTGLPGCETLIDPDIQIDRRFRVLNLRLLDVKKDTPRVRDAVTSFAKIAEMDATAVTGDDFLKRLFHAGMCRFGIVVEYVQDAIRIALTKQSGVLTPLDFARVFEARTGASAAINVFMMSERWEEIDVAFARRVDPENKQTSCDAAPSNWRNA